MKSVDVEFWFGDLVNLDGDETLALRVIGIQLFPHGNLFFCSWFKSSGDIMEEWFGGWRLKKHG